MVYVYSQFIWVQLELDIIYQGEENAFYDNTGTCQHVNYGQHDCYHVLRTPVILYMIYYWTTGTWYLFCTLVPIIVYWYMIYKWITSFVVGMYDLFHVENESKSDSLSIRILENLYSNTKFVHIFWFSFY